MAADRPDFQLIVGLNHELSYDRMRKDINKLVTDLNADPPKIKIALDIDEASQKALKEQVENATKAAKNSSNRSGVLDALKSERRIDSQIRKLEKYQKDFTAASNMPEYKQFQARIDEYNKLRDDVLNDIVTDRETFDKRFNAIGLKTDKQVSALTRAGKATKSWSDRMGGLAEKFNTWLTISKLIMAAYRAIGKMVRNVIELDTAMTELKKVTNETDAAYSSFLDRAAVRAKKLGASLVDTVNATADFARLGFNISEAEKLADVATVYKNVGDGIKDISSASESIIATMQAFGIAAGDAMSIVDKFNEVGNNYAISSKGVGDALLRSAAAMQAANNSLDETIALATAANTVVKFVPRRYGNIAA